MNCFPIVILAGGFGTRVASVANNLPKSLIPISEEPFVAHQLRLLASKGFKDVVMCVGYQSDQIINFVKDGSAFQLNVKYAHDGDQLLGTGGAIQSAFSLLPESFFVIYGDAYLQCDYTDIQKVFEKSGKLGLMTIYKNNNRLDKSNVEYDGEKICCYSKTHITQSMSYIDYGLNIFSKKAFLHFAHKTHFDLSEVHEYLVKQQGLAAYEVQERFYEIGSIDGIHALEKHLTQ